MGLTIKARRTKTNVPLTLTLTSPGMVVTGATTSVAVRDGATLDSFLDFDDSTFKPSGWGTKFAPLTEISDGFYGLLGGLDVNAITNLPTTTDQLVAHYLVTAPPEAVGAGGPDIIELDQFVDDVLDEDVTGREASPNSLGRILDMQNKIMRGRIRTNPTLNQLELYDPADDTILLTWPLTDFGGGPIANVTSAPFDRAKAVET